MDLLSPDDWIKIAGQCLESDDVKVLSCDTKFTGGLGSGFLSESVIIDVSALNRGKNVKLSFFIKALPENEYHRNNILSSKIHYKETEFFVSVLPGIAKYFAYTIAPRCYHADGEKLLVLENLVSKGYRNPNSEQFFDVPHCKAVLTRLASFHASSFLYEKEMNSTIDEIYPHLSCEKINWFKDEKGHPGYVHCQTGVRVLGVLLDCFFGHVKDDVRSQVKTLLASNPSMWVKSKNYRNALNHCDIWSNNLMIKYDDNNQIEDVIFVDYQLFSYCPPSVDVYCFLYFVTDKQFRQLYLNELVNYYFEEFRKFVESHSQNPDEFLTRTEFDDSVVHHGLPVALTNTVISMHYVLLPHEFLAEVFENSKATKKFMEEDRTNIVLRALGKNEKYRVRILNLLSECIDYVSRELTST